MLLACYSHKHISYRIRTIIRKAIFSRLEIKAEEVISQEFDDILKLVERSFRKLSLKCHPDKEKDEEKKKIATEKFQKLSADKKELEKHLNAL